MPVFDLNSPTELLLQWGWFLVTRANGIVYLLIIAVFIVGMLVRLPRTKRDIAAVAEARQPTAVEPPSESGV